MGLAASQARLLFITARQNDVSARMQKISSANMVLARDEDDVMTKYNQMINATKLQPLNGDETIVTYEALMGITAAANNIISIVTNEDNQVVLTTSLASDLGITDANVKKEDAAAKLSSYGINSPDDIKTKLAAKVAETNIPQKDDVKDITGWNDVVDKFIGQYGKFPSKEHGLYFNEFAHKMGSITRDELSGFNTYYATNFDLSFEDMLRGTSGQFVEIAADGDTSGVPSGQAAGNFEKIFNKIAEKINSTLGMGEDSQLLTMLKDYQKDCIKAINDWNENSSVISDIVNTWETSTRGSADNDHMGISMERLFKTMLSKVSEYYGSGTRYTATGKYENNNSANAFKYDDPATLTFNEKGYPEKAWTDRLKMEWINQGYKAAGLSWAKALSAAKQEEKVSLIAKGTQKVDYYTNLYNELKSRGWAFASGDVDEKIQSGEYKVAGKDIHYTDLYEEVPDEETRAKAETYYNQEMKKIQRKEKMLDNELTKLNTEYSALTNDYNSVKGILDANIQKSFTYCQTG